MPNNSFLNSLLTPIRDLIMKSRPAYKDYLGKNNITKIDLIYDTIIQDTGPISTTALSPEYAVSMYSESNDVPDIKSLLTEGTTYGVIIDDVAENVTARTFMIEGIPIVALSTLDKFPETNEEIANLPENYWLFMAVSMNGTTGVQCIGAGTFVGKTIKVGTLYNATEDVYDIKLLPEELLPDCVAKKAEVTAEIKKNLDEYMGSIPDEDYPGFKEVLIDTTYNLSFKPDPDFPFPEDNGIIFSATNSSPLPPILSVYNGVWRFARTSIRICKGATFEEELTYDERFTGLVLDDLQYQWGVIVVRDTDNNTASIALKKVTAYGSDVPS